MREAEQRARGDLYLVSLPIGNLADITLRAVDVLNSVAYILAEDTRITRRILDRHGIETPFFASFYEGAEHRRVDAVVSLLREGNDVALVSDAGTPLISDPGYPLVRAAIEAEIRVIPVPGPTAAIAAVIASGLPADRFCFEGAVPRKTGARHAFIERVRTEQRTTVVYESPHRLVATLEDLAGALPDRRLVLARELTKVHEEFLRGTAAQLLKQVDARSLAKGECVLVIAGAVAPPASYDQGTIERLLSILKEEGTSSRSVLKVLTSVLGVPRNEAYNLIRDGE
jgi:16S rRNA (cytidine1402-2'-O)-methyltransferase